MALLDSINSPKDLQQLKINQLPALAEEIRNYITETVSDTGGHLASNLGMVEITIAMHYVFDFSVDKLLFDVGHQCYTHKILTGRKAEFKNLRKADGLSGFPDQHESEYDQFKVGHAGTAVSTAIGMAMGAVHNKTDEKVVSLVGDASIVNGTSFEGLNNLSLLKRQMLIVLNDNSMAIDITQGALAKYLSKVRLSHTYEDMRKTTNHILEHLPLIGRQVEGAIERFKKTLRMAISAGQLFESLNLAYFGPVDGHDIVSLVELFRAIKDLDHPAILHIYTKKGKGFTPAKDNPTKYHSTGPFEINGKASESTVSALKPSFTSVFSDALVETAKKDDSIVAITAAMPDGTGLMKFRENFPSRYFDVGIAEGVAVDIAAGMAKQGLKPFVCIYSTFFQRSFDHIFQEISLQNLPVVLCIDRAGVVGSDGPTHHGMLDIAYLRSLPNLVLIAPGSEAEVYAAIEYASQYDGPVAIRYPRDTILLDSEVPAVLGNAFETGKSVEVVSGDSDIVLVAYGSVLAQALEACELLKEQGVNVTVINARFAKPLDSRLVELVGDGKQLITVEDHSLTGGFGSAVLEMIHQGFAAGELKGDYRPVVCLGGKDEFIKMDTRAMQLKEIGVDAGSIVETVNALRVVKSRV